jgi:hypothetical protein
MNTKKYGSTLSRAKFDTQCSTAIKPNKLLDYSMKHYNSSFIIRDIIPDIIERTIICHQLSIALSFIDNYVVEKTLMESKMTAI